ncbi:MAG: NF038122 family metalloprotease [Acidobacteriota bacterium]
MKYPQFRWLSLFLFLCVSACLFPLVREQAQTKQPPAGVQLRRWHTTDRNHQLAGHDQDGHDLTGSGAPTARYVLRRTEDGVACRRMTEAEANTLRLNEQRAGMEFLPRETALREQAQGLKINLRGTSQLNNFPQARDAFTRAAAVWESIIQTQISIVLDVDFGPTLFGAPYPGTDTLGATDPQVLGANNIYSLVRLQMVARGTSPQQLAVLNALPGNSVNTDAGTTSSVFSSSASLRALGLLSATANPATEQNFGAPPSIGFNSAFAFDFDPSNGIDPDKQDFEAVAVHEIGHALGFFSNVGFRELIPVLTVNVSPWDLYRFRPGVNLTTFTNGQRLTISGGEHRFFAGGEEIPLSTGRPDGTDGDQEQAAHWKDSVVLGRALGVMVPGIVVGQRLRLSANDLTAMSAFGYGVRSDATVAEELSTDDTSIESSLARTNALLVNRLTPARYPAKVDTVRVRFAPFTGGVTPVGAPLRVVIFNDPQRRGTPPANPTYLYDQTITIPTVPVSRVLELTLPNGPTVNSGDIYIGVQSSSANVVFGADSSSAPQLRSFVSTDNGGSFAPLRATVNNAEVNVNLLARVVVTSAFGNNTAPALSALSPSAVAPGAQNFTLYLTGNNFQLNSVVRWNGADRATTWQGGGLLQAAITAADVASAGTANVTVFTPGPGGGESLPLSFSIAANNPVPTLARLDPGLAATGGAQLTLNAVGTNFVTGSVLRWNGADRQTTITNSTQLSATIPATDLANASTANVTIFTPGPGGGTSNALPLNVLPCAYALSETSQNLSAIGSPSGVVLTTASPCAWTAQSDASWLTVNTPSGTGKGVITFTAPANPGQTVRTGTITVGGRALTIRQLGALASVSAASFAGPLAPESIGAAFGAGLASSTQVGNSLPLPTSLAGTTLTVRDANLTSRLSPLFFVSGGQINFLVPKDTVAGTAQVSVRIDGTPFANGNVTIAAVAPSLFAANSSGKDAAAAVLLRVRGTTQTFEPVTRFDAAQNKFVPVPIDFGPETDRLFLLLFGSGIRGRSAQTAVVVKLGDIETPVQFAGPQGDLVGLDQINLELPRTLKGKGEVIINLTVDGRAANRVTVAFQ